MSSMTIRKKITLCSVALGAGFVLQAGVSLVMEHMLTSAAEDERLIATALHNHMQADMKHDAIRGSVYGSLYAAEKSDTRLLKAASDDVADFSKEMRAAIEANTKLPLGSDIETQLGKLHEPFEAYIKSAKTIVGKARTNPAAAQAMLDDFEASFRDLETAQDDVSEQIKQAMQSVDARADWMANISLIVLLAISLLFAAGLAFVARFLNRAVVLPIDRLAGQLRQLATGKYDVAIDEPQGDDEITSIQSAAKAFRETAIARQEAEREQSHVVHQLAEGLDALAEGDLTHRIAQPFAASYEELRETFNRASQQLAELMQGVANAAMSVATGAGEIRAASDDLAVRNEQQAASLEETAAAMNQATEAVRQTASRSSEVQQTISGTHREASEGGEVVRRANAAMAEIENSAREITQIIDVIDGIAFQTNLLAFNAGVEAARAGDAGKGFAVVANEVRALAQRSAEAARNIKELITASTEQVDGGVALVNETGNLLGTIVTRIGEINELIDDIAGSANDQALNLKQVNGAVGEMDRMTQQNAAMVEESTAAARSLAHEATELTSLVSRFRTSGEALDFAAGASAKPAAGRKDVAIAFPGAETRRAKPAAVEIPATDGNLALSPSVTGDDDDWSEF